MATPDFEKEADQHRKSPDFASYSDDPSDAEKSQYHDRPPHAGGGQIGDQNISPFLRSHPQTGVQLPEAQAQAQQQQQQQQPSGSKTPPPLYSYPTARGSPESHASIKNRAINRADLRAAAERILYTYLLPGSERECVLPREMVLDIQTAIEKDLRDDPEIFDAAREYIFEAMERDAFPGFFRAKALGNLVRLSSLFRLMLGLLALFAGLWTGFALIFLGYGRNTRCWVSTSFRFWLTQGYSPIRYWRLFLIHISV